MEVRCGACNKLFRVSDDKITGRGIKFACTRCGEYVKITQQDFQNYTLSRNTASALDQLASKTGAAAVPPTPETEVPVSSEAAIVTTESTSAGSADLSATGDEQEETAPPFIEPEYSQHGSVTEHEPAVESRPEPLMQPQHHAVPTVEPQPDRSEGRSLSEKETSAATAPSPPTHVPIPQPETPDSADSVVSSEAEPSVDEPVYPQSSPRSSRWILFVLGTLIILGLAAYGVFFYLKPSLQNKVKVEAPVHEMTSTDGLQLISPVGSMDANGDLLVTGIIDNASNTDRADWYVELEIYNAQGAVLSKIRLLNGNQIYSRRDYEILAKRGVNVQELKNKILHDQGIVVPRNGRVNFEARYIQPPPGISSFIVQILPFDREQLNKEIADEMK
jgi:hypothetical protein